MKQTNFPELLKVTEVAEVFNCTPASVRNMIRNESLSAIRLPSRGRSQLRVPVTELQRILEIKVRKPKTKLVSNKQKSTKRVKIEQILNEQAKEFEKYILEVCNKLDCNVDYLRSKSRNNKISELRHMLAFVGKVEFDLNDFEIGTALNRNRTSVIYARKKLKTTDLSLFQIQCIDACREAYKEMYDKDFIRLQLTE